MKKFYLAYGSNLNIQQMKFRCPDAKIVGKSEISGYELLFKGSKTGSYLTIEKAENASVPVAVWEVSQADEQRLDLYEGYPNFYYKKQLEITVNSRKVTAFVYIMHEDRPPGIPSKSYVQTCLQGYRDFGFDIEILEKAISKSQEELQ